MSSSEEPAVRGVLRGFADGRVDHLGVIRALVEHDGWVVPMATMLQHYGPFESAAAMYVLGDQPTLPDGTLWVFTDLQAAMSGQAYGYVPGPCAGGVSGLTLFRDLPATWNEVMVNVGSPVEESFYQQPHETQGYQAVTRIAQGVRIERALAGCPPENRHEFAELVRRHDAWWVVLLRNQTLLSAYSAGEGPPFLMAFTAPDRAVAGLKTVGKPGLLADARIQVVDGTRLFDPQLASAGYHGLAINGLPQEGGIVFEFAAGSGRGSA